MMAKFSNSAEEEENDSIDDTTSLSYSMNLSRNEQKPLIRRRTDAVCVYKSYKMNVLNKICYGLGGAPYELTNSVIGFYISIFLLETALVPPLYASLILFFGRIWDGISDPIVAYLVSRTDTQYGVLKPWMFAGAPLATIAYFFFWYVPETDNQSIKVLWYFIFYCAFQTFLTFYQMPFGTYMLFVTDKQEERDSAENFRMGIEMVATIIGNVVMGFMLSFTDTKGNSACSTNITNVTVTIPPHTIELQIKSYMIGAICICGIFIICAIAVLVGTTEIKSTTPFKVPRDEPFLAALKRVVTFKPWLLHVGSFLNFVMALQFMQANFVLYSKYDVGMSNYQNAVLIVLVSAFLFIPVWESCKSRYGKKRTLACGMLQCVPLIIAWGFMEYGLVWLQYILSVALGSCLSVIHVAAWAMVPDVIDDFVVQNRCSYETIFFTFYLMFIKFAAGISLGLSNFILGIASGYDTGACEHPESIVILKLLVTLLPSVGIITGYFFLWFYPITEDVRNKNITILEIWREESGESNGKSKEFSESVSTWSTKTFM